MTAPKSRTWLLAVVVSIVVLAFLAAAFAVGSFVAAPRFFLLAPGLIVLLLLANFGLIVAAVVHALTRDDLTGVQRIVWILLTVFVVPVVAVGALVYFALGRARTSELFRDLTPAPQATPPPPPYGPPR